MVNMVETSNDTLSGYGVRNAHIRRLNREELWKFSRSFWPAVKAAG